MTEIRFAAKFAIPIVLSLAALVACQGVYVAGDAGPHSTRATTQLHAAPTSR